MPRADPKLYKRTVNGCEYWTCKITVKEPITGKSRPVWINDKDYDRAYQKRLKALAQRNAGNITDKRNITIGQLVNIWLEEKALTVDPETLKKRYQCVARNQVSRLGHLNIHQLTRGQLESFYRLLVSEGYASATIEGVTVVLGGAYDMAVANNWAESNPVRLAKKPKMPEPEQQGKKALTKEELALLLNKNDPYYYLWALEVSTGLRNSELAALRWDMVDLDNHVIRISRTRTEYGGYKDKGKSHRAMREVDIPEKLCAILAQVKASRKQNQPSFVVLDEDGKPVTSQWISRRFRNRWDELMVEHPELKEQRFYNLRHSFATHQVEAGVPIKTVAKRLGNDVAVALRNYVDVTRTQELKAAEAAGALL